MPTFRNVITASTDLACSAIGRRNAVRAARFVLRRASLDVPNDMHGNGETSLQRWIAGLSPRGRKLHVLDIGANVGHWSASMLAAARQAGRAEELDLHAFEPASWTFARLSERLGGVPQVTLKHAGLSDRSGSSVLYLVGEGAGTNSLHRAIGPRTTSSTEEIVTTTIDEYAEQAALDDIALIKIDTEGHDLTVLLGAQRLLAERKVSVVQFEYNWRWVEARSFLNDAFNLFEAAGYRLGKLTPGGVEFLPCWDPDLETFVEGNYVAALPVMAEKLPSVQWWKLSRSKVKVNR